jgi:DNA invertase Pin-like site-specific DNA recombinase
MSDKTQSFSIEHQLAVIYEYAAKRGIEVIHVYADPGRSGLTISGRPGLQELISTVETGRANFNTLLVFDVTRWGRFQDPDESAHYEFICKRAGISVCYCAESFKNDGSPISSLEKGIKRLMAAERSRDLSNLVFAAQCRFIKMGYLNGSPYTLGLRRVPVKADGTRDAPLLRGERKRAVLDRVTLGAGPEEEIKIVREIFDWYVSEGLTFKAIANRLNERAIPCHTGRAWNIEVIKVLLRNEKYIGNIVYGMTTAKLRSSRKRTPETNWIREEGVIPAIVDPVVFAKAQQVRAERCRERTDGEMTDMLQAIFAKHGRLTDKLINKEPGAPSSNCSGQPIPDTTLSFSSVTAGANP